jgi:arginine exporter protein ArgO
MYPILDQELQTLVSGYTSIYLALFGMAFGAFLTLFITVLTVQLETSEHRFFKDATLITGIFTVILGFMAWRDWWRSSEQMKKLKKETSDVEIRTVESSTGDKAL